MRLNVADLMSEQPVTVPPECSADAAVELLSRHNVTELYVTDERGRLLGVLPDYELLKAELNGEARQACAEQLMSRHLPVFSPLTDAAEVARLFRDGRYCQFPVVSRGRLVGIITRADVVRFMAVLRRIDGATPTSPKVRPPKLASRVRSPRAPRLTTSAATPRRRVTLRAVSD